VKPSSPSARRAVREPAVARDRERRTASPNSAAWVRAGASGIHGRGVYARIAIPEGTRIIQYIGERITKAEASRREHLRVAREQRGGDGCVTIFELNKRHDVDGRRARNTARFINHSCAPNCRVETIRGQIWIIARRHIAAGEELTFDYGYSFAHWSQHPCHCGAPRCVGYIVNAGQRWRVRRILRRSRESSRRA
jgi:SET domain-containing protein